MSHVEKKSILWVIFKTIFFHARWCWYDCKTQSQQPGPQNCYVTQQAPSPAKRHSLSTWCTLGVSPSAPPWTRRSRRDAAKDRAAAHASNPHQRKRQPCSALRFSTAGSARARAFARCLMNDTASKDHLPPTSKASTTNLALCPCWTSSG